MNPIGNELILCSQTYDDTVDFRKFGNTIVQTCQIDLHLLGKGNYTTYFYQMYLKLNESNFQVIPVQIGNNVNNNGAESIVKRFFLVYQYTDNNNRNHFILANQIIFLLK